MSKGQRFSLAQATEWADEAVERVARHAPVVVVAGSIRRKRADVGDIDLVALDFTSQNPWQKHEIGVALAELGYDQTKDGDRIASFTRAGKAGLDIYYATVETWGITLLVRTGSAAHNIKLAQRGQRILPARRLKVSQGVVDTAGRVVASRTEEDIFRVLGVPYVQPVDREALELEHMVREMEA